MDMRIMELLEMAAAEGFALPYSPEFIIAQEDAGHVVNLDTGAIILGEANRPYEWELTSAGRAVARGGEV
jgi:hypothetical protein